MQTAIVFVIITVAAIYVARVFYKGFKHKQTCSCGCSCCTIADTCSSPSNHVHPGQPSKDQDTPCHR